MRRNRGRSLQILSGRVCRVWVPVIACVSLFLGMMVLVPIHRCQNHHSVSVPIGPCHCPWHSLSTAWHEGASALLVIRLAASALLPQGNLQSLSLQSLEYHTALQRAPPLLVA